MRSRRLALTCISLISLGAGAVLAGPTAAQAGPTAAPDGYPDLPVLTWPGPRDKVEPMHLGCAGMARDGEAAAACRWSQARHPAAAGYRLWRGTPEGDRVIVFETRDLAETHYFDRGVRPDTTYLYVVEAVAGDGTVVGRSGPVRVHTSSGDPHAPVDPAPRPKTRA